MLEAILMCLDQPFEGGYSALFHRFQQYLRAEYKAGRKTILIIDEAQNLQPSALESLRMLSNINADKDQFLQLIIVGQPQLKDLLGSPQLVQFAQRVSADFHIRPLNAAEVSQYIEHRLAAVGARQTLFSAEACALIAEASRGVPRSINILCDTALIYGYSNHSAVITRAVVDDVIKHKRTLGVFAQPTAVAG
jgi:type II secretory pathway predicted ATPase ExeA